MQGDTTTVFAAALAAFYEQIPVAHLEAGLRTGDAYSPYPEEINRRLATRLAALHLAPTATSRANLLARERGPGLGGRHRATPYRRPALGRRPRSSTTAIRRSPTWTHTDAPVLLVTAHRRESWGAPLRAVGRALAGSRARTATCGSCSPSTATRWSGRRCCPPSGDLPNVTVTEPLPYGGSPG